MVQIDAERKKILRAKEIIRTTDSPFLKRDLQKYVKRAEREISWALRHMREVTPCPVEPIQTASRT